VPIQRFRFSGILVLIIASLLVAASILVGGSVGRGLNGAAALLWVASLIMIWKQLGADRTRLPVIAAAIAITFTLVVLLKPSNLLMAGLGFAVAGILVAVLAGHSHVQWSAIIPALWLPLHLTIAIGGALIGADGNSEIAVRTDAPPTEAFVPFVMVAATLVGGFVGATMRRSWQRRPENHDRSNDTAATTSSRL
jgi:hypothetical protein